MDHDNTSLVSRRWDETLHFNFQLLLALKN